MDVLTLIVVIVCGGVLEINEWEPAGGANSVELDLARQLEPQPILAHFVDDTLARTTNRVFEPPHSISEATIYVRPSATTDATGWSPGLAIDAVELVGRPSAESAPTWHSVVVLLSLVVSSAASGCVAVLSLEAGSVVSVAVSDIGGMRLLKQRTHFAVVTGHLLGWDDTRLLHDHAFKHCAEGLLLGHAMAATVMAVGVTVVLRFSVLFWSTAGDPLGDPSYGQLPLAWTSVFPGRAASTWAVLYLAVGLHTGLVSFAAHATWRRLRRLRDANSMKQAVRRVFVALLAPARRSAWLGGARVKHGDTSGRAMSFDLTPLPATIYGRMHSSPHLVAHHKAAAATSTLAGLAMLLGVVRVCGYGHNLGAVPVVSLGWLVAGWPAMGTFSPELCHLLWGRAFSEPGPPMSAAKRAELKRRDRAAANTIRRAFRAYLARQLTTNVGAIRRASGCMRVAPAATSAAHPLGDASMSRPASAPEVMARLLCGSAELVTHSAADVHSLACRLARPGTVVVANQKEEEEGVPLLPVVGGARQPTPRSCSDSTQHTLSRAGEGIPGTLCPCMTRVQPGQSSEMSALLVLLGRIAGSGRRVGPSFRMCNAQGVFVPPGRSWVGSTVPPVVPPSWENAPYACMREDKEDARYDVAMVPVAHYAYW